MALISKEEIIKLARMSRIAVHEQEIEQLSKHLNDILTYAARVSEIAGSFEGELKEPQNVNVWRDDQVVVCNGQRLVDAAAVHESNYFVVPAIIEHE